MSLPNVTIYTDGACSGNPGPGGWGALLVFADQEQTLSGHAPDTTNNRMELLAIIEALRSLKTAHIITLVTDSKYAMQGMTEWIENWKRKGWKTANKKPVKNKDLWIALDEQVTRHDLTWQWVRGHDGHPGNERADALATSAIVR